MFSDNVGESGQWQFPISSCHSPYPPSTVRLYYTICSSTESLWQIFNGYKKIMTMGTTCQVTSNLLCQRKYFSSCHEDWKKIRNPPSIGSSLKVAPLPFPLPCCPLLLPSFPPLFPRWNPTEQSMPWEDFSRLIFSALIYIYFYSRKIYHWVMQRYIKIWTLQIPEISVLYCVLGREEFISQGEEGFCLILLITSFPLCLLYTNHPLSLTEGKGTLNQSQFGKLEKISCQARSEGEKVPGRLCCKR